MNLRGATLLDPGPRLVHKSPLRRQNLERGVLGYDKKGRPVYSVAGGSLGYEQTLATLQSDGPALTNSTTATSLLGAATNASAQSKVTLPAGYFFAPGVQLRIGAKLRLSNVVTTPGNLTLDLRLGSIVVFNGGAIALSTTAHTNVTTAFEAILTCRTVGPGTLATLFGTAQLRSEAFGATAGIAQVVELPVSAPAVGNGFDSTAAQQLDFFATFSVANAANSIQVHQYWVESMN